jgi:hypothetical protein
LLIFWDYLNQGGGVYLRTRKLTGNKNAPNASNRVNNIDLRRSDKNSVIISLHFNAAGFMRK